VVGSTLYFQANDGVNVREFWKSDGTASGTVPLTDINPGVSFSSPNDFTVVGSTRYFTAIDAKTGERFLPIPFPHNCGLRARALSCQSASRFD